MQWILVVTPPLEPVTDLKSYEQYKELTLLHQEVFESTPARGKKDQCSRAVFSTSHCSFRQSLIATSKFTNNSSDHRSLFSALGTCDDLPATTTTTTEPRGPQHCLTAATRASGAVRGSTSTARVLWHAGPPLARPIAVPKRAGHR